MHVSTCTPASISLERLNWLCSNLLREQRPIWCVASTKQWGCQCTCAIAHSTSFYGLGLNHRWIIIKTSMGVGRQRQGSPGWMGTKQSRRRCALNFIASRDWTWFSGLLKYGPIRKETKISLFFSTPRRKVKTAEEAGHFQMMTDRFRHYTWCVWITM